MRMLNESDIKYAEMQAAAGKPVVVIAQELAEQGVVNRNNSPIGRGDVAYALRKIGPKRPRKKAGHVDMGEVQQLMESNLPAELKEKFLRMLMGGA